MDAFVSECFRRRKPRLYCGLSRGTSAIVVNEPVTKTTSSGAAICRARSTALRTLGTISTFKFQRRASTASSGCGEGARRIGLRANDDFGERRENLRHRAPVFIGENSQNENKVI
jgi:hypothetical protein